MANLGLGRGLSLLVAGALTACGSSTAPEATTATRPNIIVILADDLGYSDLGAFGSEIRTPNLDRLAAEGQTLTNLHTTQLCSTTRAELLTGADHHLVGIGSLVDLVLPYQSGKPGYEAHLNDKARTIAQLLRDSGYHSYMAGKWHLGDGMALDWGFEDAFEMGPMDGYGNNFPAPEGRSNTGDRVFYDNGEPTTLPPDTFSTDYFVDRLISTVESSRGDGKPFFLYLPVQAVHWPLQAPDEYLDRYAGVYDAGYAPIRAARLARQKELGLIPQDFEDNPGAPIGMVNVELEGPIVNRTWNLLTPQEQRKEARSMEVFAAMLENLDDNIGRLIDYLKRTGQYDNSFIAFLSDNGADGLGCIPPTGFVDNDIQNYGRQASFVCRSSRWGEVGATPFRLYKGFATEGGLSSPTIVKLPGSGAEPGYRRAFSSVRDIAPTILQLAGIGEPGDDYEGRRVAPIEGRSLLPLLESDIAPEEIAVAGEVYNYRYVRRGDWKLTKIGDLPFTGGLSFSHAWQLYNVADDRAENHNLAAQHPEIVDALIADWQHYVERVGVATPPLDP